MQQTLSEAETESDQDNRRKMDLRYTSPFKREPGIIAWLLKQSYAKLLEADPELWGPEKENWEEFDRLCVSYLLPRPRIIHNI